MCPNAGPAKHVHFEEAGGEAKEEVDLSQMQEPIELEEGLKRADSAWWERCDGIRQLDRDSDPALAATATATAGDGQTRLEQEGSVDDNADVEKAIVDNVPMEVEASSASFMK